MKYVLFVLALAACGGDDSSAQKDAAVDAFASECGFPGDMGNEIGVGQFCDPDNHCPGTAPLCSSIGDDSTHFCSKICQMGSTTACGTGAECVCNATNQCGCTPSACLN